MTSANGWLKKITSRAQSVREIAKTRMAQVTDTLDQELKKAQDGLEKQRSKAEISKAEVPQQEIWRQSTDNPDGELSTRPKPPPITIPTISSLPEVPQISTPPVEAPTIRHRSKRRPSKKNDSENDASNEQSNRYVKQRDNRKKITLCSNAISTEIVDRENIDQCLNELIDIIVTVDQLVESTASIGISYPQDSILEQNSSSHVETTIDTDKKQSISSETKFDQANIPIDESTPLVTNISHESVERSNSENIQPNNSNDNLPTLTIPDDALNVDTSSEGESSILTRADDTQTNQFHSENFQINAAYDELLMLTNSTNASAEHTDAEDDLPTLTNTDENAKDIQRNSQVDHISIEELHPEYLEKSKTDNEMSPSMNITDTKITHTDSKDHLPTSTNNDNEPLEHTEMEKISMNTTDDELPISTIEHSDSSKIYSITFENDLQTPPNELEDSFDRLQMSNVAVHPAVEEPLEQSTGLVELRNFLSNIENDVDEESSPFKEDTKTWVQTKNNHSKQLDPPNLVEDIFPSSLSNSISDDTSENIIADSSVQLESLSDDLSINEKTSMVSNEAKIIEEKRFFIVNYQSLPLGTKISHMNCSSTYIYICSNDRKLFYAKFNIDNIDLPLKWQQHSDLAERLVVSASNRTVWRLLNKRVYSSNDPMKFPPIGSQWNQLKIGSSLLSMSINDQCGWCIKEDGTLWLIRTDNEVDPPLNVPCPFNLNTVFCFSEKVGVTTSDGEILIRVGCTNDCREGDGWIFVEHNLGPIDDFVLLTNHNIIFLVDKKHHLWIHQWSSEKGFFEVLCDDDVIMSHQRYLISVNPRFLALTDCEKQIQIFSDCLTGVRWTLVDKNTRLQRLIGAFSNENHVWTLTTDRMICSSNGQTLEKPRQAQYLTHATFVPNDHSQDTILWALDESCNIYVRANVEINTEWEQLDQSQFEWTRRLVHMVCNSAGVWAVDDQGYIHFRHGHISASQNVYSNELTLLPPAWITIPGEAQRHRYFSQVFCGPTDWMVYATDNKQNVYARIGINRENRVGTSWKVIEDCSALELAISEHTLWLLTSCGEIQCRENISLINPIGTRSTTLSGHFLSLIVSTDDSQVWALDSKRNLLKLDRLTVLFEK